MKIVLILHCVIIIYFIVSNTVALEAARKDDILQFEGIYKSLVLIMDIQKNALETVEASLSNQSINEPERVQAQLIQEYQKAYLEFATRRLSITAQIVNSLYGEAYEAAYQQYNSYLLNQYEQYTFESQKKFEVIQTNPSDLIYSAERYKGWYDFSFHLVEKDIHPLYENEMKPFNFLYQICTKLMPLYFFLLIGLAVYQSLAGEIESKNLVFGITNPFSRHKLFFAKFTAAVSAALAAVLVPLCVAAALLGMINGWDSPSYPVLMQRNGYITAEVIDNQIAYQENLVGNSTSFQRNITPYVEAFNIGISRFSAFQNFRQQPQPDNGLSFVPIGLLLAAELPLLIVAVIFFVGIVFLLSLLIRRGFVTAIIASTLACSSALFADPKRNLSLLEQINPLLSADAVRILSGTGGTSAMVILLATLAAALLLALTCHGLFHRLELK